MKLNYIFIDGYKNLNNLEIIWKENEPVNAIIGNNGSGKSNVLEALTIIFTALGNNEEVPFSYEIHYTLGDASIEVSNNMGRNTINGKTLSSKVAETVFPRGIFLYYCGETERLHKLALKSVDRNFEKALKKNGEIALKYISFVGLKEFGPALLSNAVFNSDIYKTVCSILEINGIRGAIKLSLKRPSWSKSAPITQDSFWNAQGTVAILLHALKDLGSLKIIDKNTAEIVIDDYSKMKSQAENAFDLFVKLELLIQAQILDDVTFYVEKNGQDVLIDELSEGEKQLTQLLCLLDATKEYRALFLLDEFDSFLHPNWQRRFAELIADIDIRGQLIFTTHSPLTLSKMRSENIRILKDGKAYTPSSSTYNRDITEVLEEIMEVGKRPEVVLKTIYDFKQAALLKDVDEARKKYGELKNYLVPDDPFWNQADLMLARLERVGK